MQKWYDELARFEREGFEVIVDKTWEEINPRDCFDDECYDIDQINSDIDHGNLDWFMLRVRVLVEGHELGASYLGGCLYKDAKEVLTDGTAEDVIYDAMEQAKKEVWPLMRKLQAINEEMERVAV
jgi:hypothetical protein